MGRAENTAELWFSPITGHCFAVPMLLCSRGAARDVLRHAGLERAPDTGRTRQTLP
jgi:hypothetical protein